MSFEIFQLESCIIHVRDKKDVWAWTDDGSCAFYIKPTEKDMFRFDPQKALNFMRHKVKKGIRRCSQCGWEGKKEEFTPAHMADLLCIACKEESTEAYNKDIKDGNICRLCGKPRSICTC